MRLLYSTYKSLEFRFRIKMQQLMHTGGVLISQNRVNSLFTTIFVAREWVSRKLILTRYDFAFNSSSYHTIPFWKLNFVLKFNGGISILVCNVSSIHINKAKSCCHCSLILMGLYVNSANLALVCWYSQTERTNSWLQNQQGART
jgi:hypothetical protein